MSRSILRNLSIRNAVARSANTSPILYHPSLSIPQRDILGRSHPSFNLSSSRSYQGCPGRPKYYRFDPNEVRNARPLISNEHLQKLPRHPALHSLIVIVVAGGGFIYFTNIEDVPVSGRRRFNIYSQKDMEKEGQMMYEQILREYRGAILPDWDKRTQMVQRVMSRLIPASGIDDVNWEVNVIHSNGTIYNMNWPFYLCY